MSPPQREPTVVVASIPALAERWVSDFAAAVRSTVAARGRFTLAVPGGSVAEQFFPALGAANLPWSGVDVFFTDERCVPTESPDSNFALARRLWLATLRSQPPRVRRMHGEHPDPARAARDYAKGMRSLLGTPPVLDMALVGVGEDGHVASLFPGRSSLEVEDAVVLVENEAPKPPARRLTMSIGALAASRELVIATFGSAKAAAVADALRNPASALPLALLLRRARHATLLLDPEAASGSSRSIE